VWFSNININIAFKEEYLKSPKDMEDAKHLRIVYSEMVDEEEITNVKQHATTTFHLMWVLAWQTSF